MYRSDCVSEVLQLQITILFTQIEGLQHGSQTGMCKYISTESRKQKRKKKVMENLQRRKVSGNEFTL